MVKRKLPINQVIRGDCCDILETLPQGSVDLVFTSPPYEDARTYGMDYKLKGEKWVEWSLHRFIQTHRICRGLNAWVVNGRTRKFQWSTVPMLLYADLHRAGIPLRKPPVFHRVGIPGSGGPDWLRDDYEFVLCSSKGKLPWSDNTACGHPPKWGRGGEMSHRTTKGTRINQRGHSLASGATVVQKGGVVRSKGRRPSHVESPLPVLANPGNIIEALVGGGVMGSKLCHEHPAPFPEKLAEFFIKSFCPPNGIVLDPFCGSGTTLAVAKRLGRRYIGIDISAEYVALSKRRLSEV